MYRLIVSLVCVLCLLASEANAQLRRRGGGCSSGSCNQSSSAQVQTSSIPQLAPLVLSSPVQTQTATATIATQSAPVAVAPLAVLSTPVVPLVPQATVVQPQIATTQALTAVQGVLVPLAVQTQQERRGLRRRGTTTITQATTRTTTRPNRLVNGW